MTRPHPRSGTWTRRAGWFALGIAALIAGALVYAWAMPDMVMTSHPHPAATYEEAVARIAAERAADPPDVAYHSIFYGQGSRTETAVVLFHGFTNAPRQMDVLARAYAAQGYNVYVPRMPHHGLADRMSKDLEHMTRDEIIKWTDDSIDIGAGLGKHVVVSGLSVGATLSAWSAANRSEVSEAVLLAPLLQPQILPGWAVKPVYQLSGALPPIWVWWNPAKKEQQKAPEMAYPRYPLRALGDFLAIADTLRIDQPQRRGKIARVVIVTNASDIAVRNDVALAVLGQRLKPITEQWVVHEIPASRGWKHDLVDPLGENIGRTAEIYRELLPLYGLDPASASATPTATSAVARPGTP